MTSYEVTGIIKKRRFRYPTSDLEWAKRLFIANDLNNLWEIQKDGKRKSIMKKKDEKCIDGHKTN